MAIDTSIYGQIRPFQAPDVLGAFERAQNMSTQALQQKRMAQEMDDAQRQSALQKASVFGNALEGMSGLSPQERAAAYPKVREELIAQGILTPQSAPEQYDEGLYRQSLMRYRETRPALENQLLKAQASRMYADAAQTRKDATKDPTKVLPADKVLALSEGRQVPKLLSELRTTVEANKDTFGPYAGRVAAANPWNERAKTIDAQVRTVRQTIGKLKEGGVLRKEDEEKYAKMLPELSDTPEIAMNKIALVEREMSAKLNDQIQDLGRAGYDVSGLAGAEMATPAIPEVLKNKRSGGMVKEAVAAPPPGMIRMQAPDGSIRLIPSAQKGAAIAAGGKVVK